MLQRLIRHPRTQAGFAWVLTGYLRLVYATTRWTLLNAGQAALALTGPGGEQRGAVVAFWHERLAMLPMLFPLAQADPEGGAVPGLAARRRLMLISPHRDGRLIASIIARLGLETIAGSSRSGGAAGAVEVMRQLIAGHFVGITPDGPRGPRRRAALGVAQLAAVTRCAILPVGAATTRHRLFRSWDRFMLPLPFGRGVVVLGAPIEVPKREAEALLPAIEAALSAACDAADAWVAAQA